VQARCQARIDLEDLETRNVVLPGNLIEQLKLPKFLPQRSVDTLRDSVRIHALEYYGTIRGCAARQHGILREVVFTVIQVHNIDVSGFALRGVIGHGEVRQH
jgi:hypothetical protein